MRIKIIFIGMILFSHGSICQTSLELVVGQKPAAVASASNLDYMFMRKIELLISGSNQPGSQNGFTDGFTNLGEGQLYYSLSAYALKVFVVNTATEQYVGGWDISTYKDHVFLGGEDAAAAAIIASAYGDEYTSSPPLTVIDDRQSEYALSRGSEKQTLGCLENNPLRYGDINNDQSPEIVTLMGKNVVISSPQLQKVIFGAHYYLADEVRGENSDLINRLLPHNNPGDPQYLADSSFEIIERKSPFPAWRSLSKLYFGDFDNDQAQDIVLWRKLYESATVGSGITGFEKLGDVFVHYKIVSGEYKLQTTASDTVKSWLTSSQLTWQQGYPSLSECVGQEGQLIPELHDPLLNDPEILQ